MKLTQMKLRILIFSALMIFSVIACQKEVSEDSGTGGGGGGPVNPPAATGRLVRIQEGIDPNLDNDTVWNVLYNAAGKISGLVDSLYGDTTLATYDAAGRLTKIAANSGLDLIQTVTYDANGLLTSLGYDDGFTKERYDFSYTNGVVSKKSFYTNAGSGNTLTHYRDHIYTVTNGNITEITIQSPSGQFLTKETFEYGTQANPFKDLAFFGQLGSRYFIDVETYFNKNLPKKATGVGSTTGIYSNAYTLDSKQRIIKAVQTEQAGGVFTWMFEYK
jgi:YD repeat-containing protein